jgi:hypothetical protein
MRFSVTPHAEPANSQVILRGVSFPVVCLDSPRVFASGAYRWSNQKTFLYCPINGALGVLGWKPVLAVLLSPTFVSLGETLGMGCVPVLIPGGRLHAMFQTIASLRSCKLRAVLLTPPLAAGSTPRGPAIFGLAIFYEKLRGQRKNRLTVRTDFDRVGSSHVEVTFRSLVRTASATLTPGWFVTPHHSETGGPCL